MPITKQVSPCDLCGGTEVEIISRHDRHGKALDTGLCLQCGLIAHQPMPNEADIAAYYRDEYRRDYHGEAAPSPRRIMRAWRNGQRIADQLQPHIKAESTVFEIGAGIGCTVKSLAERGFAAHGIEPNEQFNQYTRNILRADVENRNLFDYTAHGDQDVVLLIHVIEHFTSPVRALTYIRDLLPDDGLLYIECPNVGGPFATFGRLFHFAHTYNFSPETLILLAQRCGYACERVFTDAGHPDLQMLFRKLPEIPESVYPEAGQAERIRHAIHRYNAISYHLRPDYLQRRVEKLATYWQEFRQADAFVQALESRFRP